MGVEGAKPREMERSRVDGHGCSLLCQMQITCLRPAPIAKSEANGAIISTMPKAPNWTTINETGEPSNVCSGIFSLTLLNSAVFKPRPSLSRPSEVVCLPCSTCEREDVVLERRHCERHQNTHRHRQALAFGLCQSRSPDLSPLSDVNIDDYPVQYEDADNMSYGDEDDLTPFSELWEPVSSTVPFMIGKPLSPDDFIIAPRMDHNEIAIEGDDLFEDDLPDCDDSGAPIDGDFLDEAGAQQCLASGYSGVSAQSPVFPWSTVEVSLFDRQF